MKNQAQQKVPREDPEEGHKLDDKGSGTSTKRGTKSPARKRAKTRKLPTKQKNRKPDLSLLSTMPLDILFEILSHLPPGDILKVTRVSKVFHQTLMNRSATTIWRVARNRLNAPECPSWMSEPAWATLLFGTFCQSCGRNNVRKVDFLLLKRVCPSCRKTHLLPYSKATAHYPGILELLPSTYVSRLRGCIRYRIVFYWDTDLERIAEIVSRLEADVENDLPNSRAALLDFKEKHKQRVTQIQQASPQWQTWH